MRLEYKIHGMDCGEEVAILKRQLAPVVGGEERLVFDALQGKLQVNLVTDEDVNAIILRTVSKTGMHAQRWDEFCDDGTCGIEDSMWQRKGRLILCSISGVLILIAIAIQIVLVASDGTSKEIEATSQIVRFIYLLATVAGVWFVLPKAWYSLRILRPDMNLLMTLAVLGAIAIGEWVEAAVVSFLFAFSILLESWSVDRAKIAIKSLLGLHPEIAHQIHETGLANDIPAKEVKKGFRLIIYPGEKVPSDGVVVKGTSYVNQAPITGESKEVEKVVDDFVYAGSLNGDGSIEIVVEKEFSDTTLSNIIRQVEENQARRSLSEKWVDKFARIYTPVMMIIALLMAIIPPVFFGEVWKTWLYEALVILVIACPCALVISTPVTVVSGLASAARNGILIRGGSFLELPSKIKSFAFDKTGTITRGKASLETTIPLNGYSENDLLTIASALESGSSHPLAKAILRKADEKRCLPVQAENQFALKGRGVKGDLEGISHWVGSLKLLEETVSNHSEVHHLASEIEQSGQTVTAVFNDNHVCGLFGISDMIREGAAEVIEELKELGIKQTIMLTGDNVNTAEPIARQVGVSGFRAELLPQDKVDSIQELKRNFGFVAIVGDGINDAPAMAASDLGIAMGAIGADAAIETADVALMSDDLSKIPWLIKHSRKTVMVIKQNIFFALFFKLLFVVAALFHYASLWMAITADIGASLIVIFNGLRLLTLEKSK